MSVPLVRMVAQRHPADCGVSALAMLIGVSYEDALLALGGVCPSILQDGVFFWQLKNAAAQFGVTLTLRRKWDIEEHEGIAQVRFKSGDLHVVVVSEGLVFETDQTVWRPEDYVKGRRARFRSMLVREDA